MRGSACSRWGDTPAPWPSLATRLADAGHIDRASARRAALLYDFGTLIGNLSFTSEHGHPYTLAPAYDMLPMGFASRASGAMPNQLPPANLHARVDHRHLAASAGLGGPLSGAHLCRTAFFSGLCRLRGWSGRASGRRTNPCVSAGLTIRSKASQRIAQSVRFGRPGRFNSLTTGSLRASRMPSR